MSKGKVFQARLLNSASKMTSKALNSLGTRALQNIASATETGGARAGEGRRLGNSVRRILAKRRAEK